MRRGSGTHSDTSADLVAELASARRGVEGLGWGDPMLWVAEPTG